VVEQLPVVVASVTRPYTGALSPDAIDDLRDAVVWAVARGAGLCGLPLLSGFSTKTPGRVVGVTPREVPVCAIDAPPGSNNGATVRPAAKKSDENFMVIPSMLGRQMPWNMSLHFGSLIQISRSSPFLISTCQPGPTSLQPCSATVQMICRCTVCLSLGCFSLSPIDPWWGLATS
jgi:hypothetical protein